MASQEMRDFQRMANVGFFRWIAMDDAALMQTLESKFADFQDHGRFEILTPEARQRRLSAIEKEKVAITAADAKVAVK